MPQELPIFWWACKGTLVESVSLSLTFDAEDFIDMVVSIVSGYTSVDKIAFQLWMFGAYSLQDGHLLQTKTLELSVQGIDLVDVLGLFSHDALGILHIAQAVQEFDLLFDHLRILYDEGTITTKGMRDSK